MTDQVSLWNARASLGPSAGTGDLIAAELERRAIAQHVKRGMRVLDVGCGNGTSALWLAYAFPIEMVGIDLSPSMISEARMEASERVEESTIPVRFHNVGVLEAQWAEPFDLIYSQRCLINLPDWPTQRAAIERILSWLKPGGTYLAVECSQDGLDRTNAFRAAVELPPIIAPGHNVYLRDTEMCELGNELGTRDIAWLPSLRAICSTYAFLSRVVNARLAADEGREPAYDSPINKLALNLPEIGIIGQNVCYEFRRCH
jgi:SAM-dependent methyltransferase